MTRRAIKDFKPFDFRSDFALPEKSADDALSVSAADLAALLAEARAEGAAAMAATQSAPEPDPSLDRADAAAAKLNDALADLVELARHLEAEAGERPLNEDARRLINLAAARIIDGQGDLFGA